MAIASTKHRVQGELDVSNAKHRLFDLNQLPVYFICTALVGDVFTNDKLLCLLNIHTLETHSSVGSIKV